MKLALRQWWQNNKFTFTTPALMDEITAKRLLVFTVISLLCLGTVMITSASMPYGDYINDQPLYFIKRHMIYLVLGAIALTTTFFVPLRYWFKNTILLWLMALGLLTVVLMLPEVNGSKRWITLPGFTFQPSEFAKFVMVLFIADYVVRRSDEIRFSLKGLLRLLIPMGSVLLLIMLEPDLGASVVIVGSMMAVFFLAGAPPKQFGAMLLTAVGAVAVAILASPWRVKRLLSFTNPWADEQGDGYQLKQSLIAFGRGEWTGTGLGHSVQKLSYLPEAHTDFMLAIVGEELGFVGISILFTLSFLMVAACMRIGYLALKNNHLRAGYLAYGISVIFVIQICVNGGMNMGLMPTKGLTLPFISYGGTALVVSLMMIGVILRIERETSETATVRER
ncbi:putative lipid II flippase FtsW [Alkanindiges illinoisensis]|uniref:Probable peptidoglycan glycosyltransferase FtsW n=1 Tax=Alkanindiges illinoisensis TaxID=197183 RepID=A0A4Y7XEF6_9GAMM|nr:putative lipid II flippase FtsW [Alkanindiges illinoisensis]TEU28503.1 putative lipid II flippase FtsW [Alkanindiges illinoisensis]